MKVTRHLIALAVICLSVSAIKAADQYTDGYGDQLGTVKLEVSCNAEASLMFHRGLALLHHMTYEGSRQAFAAALESDPKCAMGYWGQAMTLIHPLWSDPLSAEEFEQGRSWLAQARSQNHMTKRERAYLAALEAYFSPGWSRKEKPNLDGFAAGWKTVSERFPEDQEALSFHALSHLSTSDPRDKTLSKQKEAGAIADQVLQIISDHPGGHHYLIHAYDYPPLAERALVVARNYGKIAPAVPHALHMPTHIFTRLGLWPDSIELNTRSAEAALQQSSGGLISLHYPHAIDYLAYAYLQQGDDERAVGQLEKVESLTDPAQAHVASTYTFAAVPARYALERHNWAEAVKLRPRRPQSQEWDNFPAMEAITHFAKALGAAHMDDKKMAREALERLSELEKKTAKTSAYWAGQIQIQRLSALAWQKFKQGDQSAALQAMIEAAEMESKTEKHPVTPGEILPARELLADMLFAAGKYDEAHKHYELALQRSPNRFNSLYGAARSAELENRSAAATKYYRQLIDTAVDTSTREELITARAYLR